LLPVKTVEKLWLEALEVIDYLLKEVLDRSLKNSNSRSSSSTRLILRIEQVENLQLKNQFLGIPIAKSI